MRIKMTRFTSLTNGFSKHLHNLKAAAALHSPTKISCVSTRRYVSHLRWKREL